MPYISEQQRKYFNANRADLEAQGVDVDEWNKASKGLSLPAVAKSAKCAKCGGDSIKRNGKCADCGSQQRRVMSNLSSYDPMRPLTQEMRGQRMQQMSYEDTAPLHASIDAEDASKTANASGKTKDHLAAYRSHTSAAAQHAEVGNFEKAKAHDDSAQSHMETMCNAK